MALAALCAAPATAQRLTIDLSSDLVAITTEFTGAEIVVFGAIAPAPAEEGPADIVIVVRGPAERVQVRRRARVAGIWMHTDDLVFANVPSFYAIAASRPLTELADEPLLRDLELGPDRLRFSTPRPGVTPAERRLFRAALLRNQRAQGLFPNEPAAVSIREDRLFSTELAFPSNVPTGHYTVEVHLFRGGALQETQTLTMRIEKVGISAELTDFARRQALAYGLVCLSVAVAAGWLANALFRRA